MTDARAPMDPATEPMDPATEPMDPATEPMDPARAPLRVLAADCSRCVGLCCVAPAFAASADFAFDKPAGDPCPNLLLDDRCRIHDRLRPSGFPGCVVFDCFGAGQRVTHEVLPGTDWRASEEAADRLFAAFAAAWPLHELLFLLRAALALPAAAPVARDLADAYVATDALAARADTLTRADVQAHRERVNVHLRAASELARAPYASSARSMRGRDLTGQDLRGLDLRGAELRGAELVGVNLRGADLDLADVTGADLRAADIRGADLRTTLFLSASQLRAATGDARTRIPAAVERPAHWT